MDLSLARTRLAPLSLLVLMIGALVAGCVPSTPVPPLSTSTPAEVATQPPATEVTASQSDAALGSQEAGASVAKNPLAASTRHYKGDPNAPIVVIEISDFQ